MTPEIREALGKAAYEGSMPGLPDWFFTWEELREDTKELYRLKAEAVVHKLALMIVPPLIGALLTEEQIRILLSEALP
jgi:hypothetical protein